MTDLLTNENKDTIANFFVASVCDIVFSCPEKNCLGIEEGGMFGGVAKVGKNFPDKLISEVLVYINSKDSSADWFSSTFYTFYKENLIKIEIYEKVNDILNTFDKSQRLSFLSAVRGILMEIRTVHYPEISMQSLTKIKEILGVFEIEWNNEIAYEELINIWENQKKEIQRFT